MEISNGHNQEMALIQPISASNYSPHNPQQEKKPKYQQNYQAPNSCPRCDSTNTKFCYYNNYSLSQPRYFCKACRRYWTKGGILRNVPVGGGCRKNKRSSSSPNSSSNSSFAKKNITKPPSESMAAAIPNFPMSTNYDLTLAFNPFFLDQNPNPNPNPSFLDILRGGGVVEPTQEISHGMCYGFGGGGNDQRGMLIPFHGGASDGRTPPLMAAAAAPGMAAVRDDDEVGGNHDSEVGLGLETGSRDNNYWNESGSISSSSTWHGLVNSSFL